MRILSFGFILALLAAPDPSEVAAQKKKESKSKDKDGETASPADYKQIQNRKEMFGTITAISKASLSLRVDTPHLEPNPKFKGTNAQSNPQYQQWKNYQELMVLQQQATLARNPQELARIRQRIAQEVAQIQKVASQQAKAGKGNSANDPFIVVNTSKAYELVIEDSAILRKMFLAFEYDDTGKVKSYTEKEKADLRGTDKSKPGYLAKMDELVAGTEVKIFLTPPKKAAQKSEEEVSTERPTVNMIVATKESPSTSTIQGAEPKRKKK